MGRKIKSGSAGVAVYWQPSIPGQKKRKVIYGFNYWKDKQIESKSIRVIKSFNMIRD